jgi:hypothetical protein
LKISLQFKNKTQPWILDPTDREEMERGPHRRLGFWRARGQGSNSGDALVGFGNDGGMDGVRCDTTILGAWSISTISSREKREERLEELPAPVVFEQ